MEILDNLTNHNLIDNWERVVEVSYRKANNRIVERIENEQDEIIKSKKELGANKWFILECYELSERLYAVSMEEGHVINYAIIKYNSEEDKFLALIESNLEMS